MVCGKINGAPAWDRDGTGSYCSSTKVQCQIPGRTTNRSQNFYLRYCDTHSTHVKVLKCNLWVFCKQPGAVLVIRDRHAVGIHAHTVSLSHMLVPPALEAVKAERRELWKCTISNSSRLWPAYLSQGCTCCGYSSEYDFVMGSGPGFQEAFFSSRLWKGTFAVNLCQISDPSDRSEHLRPIRRSSCFQVSQSCAELHSIVRRKSERLYWIGSSAR